MGFRRVVLALAAIALVAAFVLSRACTMPSESSATTSGDSAARAATTRATSATSRARSQDTPDGRRTAEASAAESAGTDGASRKTGDTAGWSAEGVPPPPPKLRIHGRIREESGRGVGHAGLEIRASSGTAERTQWFTKGATADGNGAFDVSIDDARASLGFGIETSADTYLEGWVFLKRADYDETRGVDVVVERARAIAGRVVDGEGRAIRGTRVQLWYGSETTWPTDVGPDGKFRTPSRGPRRAFELVVEAPGFRHRSVPVAAADVDETNVGDIVFRNGGRIAGVVVDRAGHPVQGLQITVDVVADEEHPSPRCRTDTEGRFALDVIGEDAVTLHVDVDGDMGGPEGARLRYRGAAEDVQPGRTDVRLVVSAQATIRLLFVDALTGESVDVGTAEYGLRYEGTPEPERLGQGASGSDPLVSTYVTAESGRRYDLTVRCPGFDVARVNGIDVGDVVELDVRVPMRRSK